MRWRAKKVRRKDAVVAVGNYKRLPTYDHEQAKCKGYGDNANYRDYTFDSESRDVKAQ